MKLNDLSKEQLLNVINEYNNYIELLNSDENRKPASIEEFYSIKYGNTFREKEKLIITLDGGVIQDVFSTNKNIDVMVVDFDYEGADGDEYWSPGEIVDFVGEKGVYINKFASGVCDYDLPIKINE